MTINTLKDVYIDQLQDLYSACKQSKSVTSELKDAASNPRLKEALDAGMKGIENGMETLEKLIKGHDAGPEGEHCKGMEGLVNEACAHGLEEDFGDSDAQDAMIITQYQRMAHYAIAGYGCCAAFATQLGLPDDTEALKKCLDASYDGDRTMTQIAENQVNDAAA